MNKTPLERILKWVFLLQDPPEEEFENVEGVKEEAPVLNEVVAESQKEDIFEQEQPDEQLHPRTQTHTSLRKMMKAHEIFSLPVSLRRNSEK